MRKKLCSRRGETMIEALVSVLLVAIVSAAMVGMVSSASRLNREADQKDEALYNAVSAAETATVRDGIGGAEAADNLSGKKGSVTVTVDGSTVKRDVTFSGSKDETVYAYTVN